MIITMNRYFRLTIDKGKCCCVYHGMPHIIGSVYEFSRRRENSIMKLSDPRTESLLINFFVYFKRITR